MIKYLRQLFIKDELFNEDILSSSLYISCDNISALRADYKDVLDKIKIYEKIDIFDSNERLLQEGYEQGLFLVVADQDLYFVRLILSDKHIYDVLLYSYFDIELIRRVFFSNKEVDIKREFVDYLLLDKPVLVLVKVKDNYKIIKANNPFYEGIKYEAWDFDNKYRNIINTKLVDDDINLKHLRMYKSDNTILDLEFDVHYDKDIICLVSK